ncbi:K(+)-stimulated pyrophosphate-energized sodium pump [Dysgonomonas sp. PFB1-18]|uniref:sodium-translocating pyrophosphatase n=1 Tax=unclassified Dysgonomonas TaxID=2630389 RepID=UPI0024765A99|nr:MULTISPECIES: sodium-translocating pyrophosphatase [unclassified Dysgonomonas]MDH6309270.1 K(+)-stimulated pyrophosphate-energized sodium pump [Dysgonomonas sp. PF1-14]MDH6338850.1 K(+)-stimulated pyrophosphate-energized sodium pump [Dysgonomonas sp. PF1-16]MDH6380519.1 K(+)-stimulated pyrophosphate-energized sodium pump [Dysgonomonas sp. PFB1-18]MDH6397678.1 K(+)-stimulated pyrophosphate-energized sodium pump [Dysgonomonas sp. PF1-23]
MKKLLSLSLLLFPLSLMASEADLKVPDLGSGYNILLWGLLILLLGIAFGLVQYFHIKKLPVHSSMLNVSKTIYETCKTYLLQQGRFLFYLLIIISVVMLIYFGFLSSPEIVAKGEVSRVTFLIFVLFWTVLGILGSYGVAWYGIRINTLANSRTSFASLRKRPWDVVSIPLKAGMSVGVMLITVELIMMLVILLFVPGDMAGACLIGFAIGESLGASALRIAGGIFTKIADIGADLMKIVFNIKEDDPRNPGVIADCTGDNAGDSVGPTADGFETYGVTGVALISFIVLAVLNVEYQAVFIVWIFVMRLMMLFTSILSYYINQGIATAKYRNSLKFNFEIPLTALIWITSVISIVATYIASYFMLKEMPSGLWWKLASIISCGTLAAAVIPELTKAFTSSSSRHVKEVVTASREGGPSLNILSGMVAGNFSAFWKGLTIALLMAVAYFISMQELGDIMLHPSIFAFGLVAFGLLGMGPVTIAVDSYGPVTDNAQSVFELSRIEHLPNISAEIEKEFGFEPDFEKGKEYLEENDSAGNTFKATAKPVLIGTAVIGATTMIFSIILVLEKLGILNIDLIAAPVLLGFICGGSVIYWFSGASMQAVTTGAYRAVEYIKKHINLNKEEADIEDSKAVVKICTKYAQVGMWNIFLALLFITLAFAFIDPNFFVAYLISIAVFGLFQAIYMANAGGAWDNAKKIVEVELKERNTDLHAATVVGDTVGDPYKDTSSVSLNPIIKFSTLFGLLAVEIAIEIPGYYKWIAGLIFLAVALVFVYRSFYQMRIVKE